MNRKELLEQAKGLVKSYAEGDRSDSLMASMSKTLYEIAKLDEEAEELSDMDSYIEDVVTGCFHSLENYSGGVLSEPVEVSTGFVTKFYEDDGNVTIKVVIEKDGNLVDTTSLLNIETKAAYEIAKMIDDYDYESFDNYFTYDDED